MKKPFLPLLQTGLFIACFVYIFRSESEYINTLMEGRIPSVMLALFTVAFFMVGGVFKLIRQLSAIILLCLRRYRRKLAISFCRIKLISRRTAFFDPESNKRNFLLYTGLIWAKYCWIAHIMANIWAHMRRWDKDNTALIEIYELRAVIAFWFAIIFSAITLVALIAEFVAWFKRRKARKAKKPETKTSNPA